MDLERAPRTRQVLRRADEHARARAVSPRGLTEELGREALVGAVAQRSARGRDRHRAEPRAIIGRHVRVVQYHVGRHPKAAMAPGAREREMDVGRQHVGQPVERERRLVREHAGTLRPEPGDDQLFVLAHREVGQAVDAAPDTSELPGAGVMDEELRRVASLGRLLRREHPLLGGRRLVQEVPVGMGCQSLGHAQNVSHTLVLRNHKSKVWLWLGVSAPARPFAGGVATRCEQRKHSDFMLALATSCADEPRRGRLPLDFELCLARRRVDGSATVRSVTDLSPRAVEALLAAPSMTGRRIAGVWLFGSVARGEERPDSDVDLAVLCEPELALERTLVMDQVGRTLGRDVDVIDLRAAPPALAWEILTTGRLVLERDELAVERFVRSARYAAEDDEQRSRMVLLAQVGQVGGSTR